MKLSMSYIVIHGKLLCNSSLIAVKNKINCFHMASANEALRIAKLANTRNFYQPFECMSFMN